MGEQSAATRASLRLGSMLWEAWSRFWNFGIFLFERCFSRSRNFKITQERPFPWQIPLLATEIGLLIIFSIFWACRLSRRGKELKERAKSPELSFKRCSLSEDESRQRKANKSNLLRKAKDLYIARLTYNQDEIDRMENALKDHIASVYKQLQESDGKDARRLMVTILRKTLIQHPYDQIGRRMASEAKDIFVQKVLKETNCVHKLKGGLKTAVCLKMIEKTKKLLVFIPALLALLGAAQKGLFYGYDIITDVKVIEELHNIPDVGVPSIPPEKIKQFADNIQGRGVNALKKPCETLDVLEEIPNSVIPFYKTVVGKIANVHWNPTRNSTFPLSDAFHLTRRLSEIYKDALMNEAIVFESLPSKPSDIKGIIQNLKQFMAEAKKGLEKTDRGITGFFVRLFVKGKLDTKRYLPIVKKAISILDDIEGDVMSSALVEQVLKRADEVYETRKFTDTTWPEMVRVFSAEIENKLKPSALKTWNYIPSKDPFAQQLNNSQTVCRRFIKQLFKLTENEDIKRWVLQFYTSEKSENSAGEVAKEVNTQTKFLTKYIIKSVFYFLVLNMAWTLLVELKSTIMDLWQSWHLPWRSRHLPLYTNVKMAYDENKADSPLLTSEKNCSNDYVVKSSKRHSFNILEATNETVSAINVQIALWIYMSTSIEGIRVIFKDTFDLDVTNEMFNLADESFADFWSSATMSSLLAGVFSLTFAQYKMYMTRHENDAGMVGKVVYFLSCISNSFAIFLSQIVYFTVGFPSFICVLIYIIRLIINFDEYDAMPESAEMVVIFLVLTFVLLPLKLVPIKVAELIKWLTERFFLHKTFHTNERNRSGYNVPGFETALYMFLPSSNNDLSHVHNKESFENPGFYYFSKDPLSRDLYRLRFEVQLFCKVLMHTFYLGFSFLFLNILHILLQISTVAKSDNWASKLHPQLSPHVCSLVSAVTLGMLPCLLLSFALLLIYYKCCHPWLKEGVSVGFEPRDQELWKFSPAPSEGAII